MIRGIISKHQGDFYCLNRLHSFRTENKLKSYFCGIAILSEKDILEFNQYMMPEKMPYVVYADTESLI